MHPTLTRSHRHVAVIGAGILGASTAYHLAKLAPTAQVTILDSNPSPNCATSRSAGVVLHYSSPDKCRLVRQTTRDIEALEGMLDEDVGFCKTGSMRIASNPAELEALEAEMKVVAPFSPVRWLEKEEVKPLVPWMTDPSLANSETPEESGDLLRAALIEDDGFLDPIVLAGAFLRAARALGANYEVDRVAGLDVSGDANGSVVQGVHTARGQHLACDHVVDATGVWAGVLGEASLGMAPLPMAATRSHYFTTGSMPDWLSIRSPVVVLPAAGMYVRGTASGDAAVLGVQERQSRTYDLRELVGAAAKKDQEGATSTAKVLLDAARDPEAAHDAAAAEEEQAIELLLECLGRLEAFAEEPFLANLTVPHYSAGITTYTPDGGFLLGAPDPAARGYSVISGCNGMGLSASGGLGRLAALEALGLLDEAATETAAGKPTETAREALATWSPQRPTLDWGGHDAAEGGIRGTAFRDLCAAARARKFKGGSQKRS